MRKFLTSIRLDPVQMAALEKMSQRDRRTTAWLMLARIGGNEREYLVQ
jgi:hypothetical protein